MEYRLPIWLDEKGFQSRSIGQIETKLKQNMDCKQSREHAHHRVLTIMSFATFSGCHFRTVRRASRKLGKQQCLMRQPLKRSTSPMRQSFETAGTVSRVQSYFPSKHGSLVKEILHWAYGQWFKTAPRSYISIKIKNTFAFLCTVGIMRHHRTTRKDHDTAR